MSTLKYRTVLICEDVRHEIGGRVSLIGVLTARLLVKEFPVFFPKFCIFIDWGNVTERCVVRLKPIPPEGVEFPNVEPMAEIKGAPGLGARSIIVFNNFVFPKAGDYAFEFRVNDELVGKEVLNVEKFEAPQGSVMN